MFSFAAINDTDSKSQWEPLAPTKEAQEFHLSQTYHDGLLKLQSKDYVKARELLESVLKDPLISSAQVDNGAGDGHMLQLRFLTLKNLASVFLQQGSLYYENALQCYLQAVEIDTKDSVVWNQLGTLSCSMGLLSISRWAFEQGLFVSPNNWNCMEKLLEVLIAIRDEVACLSVAELILRHWPSHSRAFHVKSTIMESEPTPFSPRGIDKLEPKHVRLNFPEKRKLLDANITEGADSKRPCRNIELHLAEPSWAALADTILGVLLPMSERAVDSGVGLNHDDTVNDKLSSRQSKISVANTDVQGDRGPCPQTSESSIYRKKLEICGNIRVRIHSHSISEAIMGATEVKSSNVTPSGENMSLGECSIEKSSLPKDKEVFIADGHSHERRSTRLERLRNRKPGKGESDFSTSRDLAKVVIQFLEPFVVGRSGKKDADRASTGISCPAVLEHPLSTEHNEVMRFVTESSQNFGAYHMGHLLLEEVSQKIPSYNETFVRFLELEKLTRHWGQDRSMECSLFLAELYYDLLCSSNDSKPSDFQLHASYNLCKVIEMVALDSSVNWNSVLNIESNSKMSTCMNDPKDASAAPGSDFSGSLSNNSILASKTSFWIRFFWLSGHLSILAGEKAKAYEELCSSLSILRNNRSTNGLPGSVVRPHCKLGRELTLERVLHEIHLLKVDTLLRSTTAELIEKEMYTNCVDLLAPLLLSTREVYVDLLPGVYKEGENVTSVELSALDILLSACEKARPFNVEVYLNCHRRKLQVLTFLAGMTECTDLHKAFQKSISKSSSASDLDSVESMYMQWSHLVVEEVKAISRCASKVKNATDQSLSKDGYSFLVSSIGDIQALLLTVMRNTVGIILFKKHNDSGTTDQTERLENHNLVDAAIAFCKLQHLDQSVPVKSQVELIVAVHDLLAEYGLCCAGIGSEGEEGTFLKFAIKHLLSVDMKMKSSFQSANKGLEKSYCLELPSENSHKKAPITETNMDTPMDVETSVAEEEKTMSVKNKAKEEIVSDGISSQGGTEHGKNESDVNVCSLNDEKVNDQEDHEDHINIERETVELGIDETVELGIDDALDQIFFCLYGLDLRSPDSSCEDDLAVHKNTNRGDYQTKEQCADVFHYLLPYAKASSRTGLVKVRKVLRAIRKQFPQPPEDMLRENPISKFLDNPDLCEEKLTEEAGSDGFLEYIMKVIFPSGKNLKQCNTLTVSNSEPYTEVYENIYYILAQAEEISATDKWPGFVLTKEGEEFVEQNANLFKYDLLYNPLRFESWQKLANIYDEEVDLLLNDGSKHINVVGWRKNSNSPQRVETSRRRSRRCLLMSLALAKTPDEQSEMHELLALVYYDAIQNVVPIYDQRFVAPTKDAAWTKFCQNSFKHFEKAFAHKPEWSHAFYLGKLSEKLGYSYKKVFAYYDQAINLNPSAVDPFYRMHASRLKLLYSRGKQNLKVLKVVAAYSFNQSIKDTIRNIINLTDPDIPQLPTDAKENVTEDNPEVKKHDDNLDIAWRMLYNDCLSALEVCVEGELKHFHKARYMLAQGWYRRGENGNLERAKDELSFCFKSSRSSFTIYMWEIEVRKGRRKTPGPTGNKKTLEVNLPESSRKFITCIRKYTLFYLKLLQETGDICTLERAYTSIRADKRFSMCLEDLVPVALGRYIQAIISSIRQSESVGSAVVSSSCEHLREKMFNLFMDQGNLWADVSSLPEIKGSELPESSFYGYLHQYIQSLERDVKLDVLEGINEKIRKRFKYPKLSSSNCAKVCRHASVAWYRSIVINLALITSSCSEASVGAATVGLENFPQLCVDIQENELWTSLFEDPVHLKSLETKWTHDLSKLKGVIIKKASEENMEAANNLLRCSYNFYRDSSCGTLPSAINLYKVPSSLTTEIAFQPSTIGVNVIDLSIPKKLLLWAYTLVHGRYSNIVAVVKHCEENIKLKVRKGGTPSLPPQTNTSTSTPGPAGGGKERITTHDDCGGAEENPSTIASSKSTSMPEAVSSSRASNMLSSSSETKKTSSSAPPNPQQCNNTTTGKSISDTQEGGDGIQR